MQHNFNHEKLSVYVQSIEFIGTITDILENVSKKHSVYSQLERAATSIPLNIAEGNGKSSIKDRCRFLEIARGSALECAACLDVLESKNCIGIREKLEAKQQLVEIVSMLVGLLKHFDQDRLAIGKK